LDIVEAISKRKSVRVFKEDVVPRKILEEIMEQALRAPSWANTQPWEFAIAGRQQVKEIGKAFVEKVKAGVPSNPDVASPRTFPEPFDNRRRGVGRAMFAAMGLGREDKEKRAQWSMQGMKLFDAPNAIFILTDRSFYYQEETVNVWPLFDCGLVAENIMLLATNYGLGTIPEIQAVSYPDILREVLGIPDSKMIVIGIAIGYPDWDKPVNQFRSDRESLANISKWCGVD